MLRRPPTLVALEGRFVPERVDGLEVDSRWRALCAENPRYFDGSLLHVLGVHRNGHGGVSIHVQESSYRFYAVQKTGLDCGIRPLGVKGISFVRDETGASRVLFGRRSQSVAFYPGQWEFVPGGALEPGAQPAAQVTAELREETTLSPRQPPIARALLFDPHAFTWEIVHAIELASATAAEMGWEYDEFRLVSLAEQSVSLAERTVSCAEQPAPSRSDHSTLEHEPLPHPLAPVAIQMLPLARRIVRSA